MWERESVGVPQAELSLVGHTFQLLAFAVYRLTCNLTLHVQI